MTRLLIARIAANEYVRRQAKHVLLTGSRSPQASSAVCMREWRLPSTTEYVDFAAGAVAALHTTLATDAVYAAEAITIGSVSAPPTPVRSTCTCTCTTVGCHRGPFRRHTPYFKALRHEVQRAAHPRPLLLLVSKPRRLVARCCPTPTGIS